MDNNSVTLKIRHIILIANLFFCSFLFTNCDLEQNSPYINDDYPTTYSKLDMNMLNNLQSQFTIDNPNLNSSLNAFGFFGFSDFNPSGIWPSKLPNLSKDSAYQVVKSFITLNSKYAGIKNPSEINFISLDSSKVSDGSISWHFVISSQIYKGLEVNSTGLTIMLINGKVTWCIGNWFPQINIPIVDKFDSISAKNQLLNQIVTHYSIGGELSSFKITESNLKSAQSKKMIYPLQQNDKIELHVVWNIYVPDVFYVLLVDVITGQIVGSYPTIIS